MKNNKIITKIITMLLSFVLLIPNTAPVLAEEVVPEETVEMRGGEEIESFDKSSRINLATAYVTVEYDSYTFEVSSVVCNGKTLKYNKDRSKSDYFIMYDYCTDPSDPVSTMFYDHRYGVMVCGCNDYAANVSISYNSETGKIEQVGGQGEDSNPWKDPNPPEDPTDDNDDSSDDSTGGTTETSDTQTTKSTSLNLTLNGTENTLLVTTTYDNSAEYTGKSVTGKTLNATTDFSSLESATGTSGVFKIKYKGKRKSVGDGSFYPQITYNKNKIDKNLKNAGWSKKQIKVIKKAVKVLNKGLKNNACLFKVTPVDLSTSEITVKAKLNKDGTPKIKSGKLQGVKSVKVKSAGGKTFTLGQKQCKISVDGETVTVTGKGKTFTGSNTATVTG